MEKEKKMPKDGNKSLKKIKKINRSCMQIVYDPKLTSHYQPHALLSLRDLQEEIPLPAIASR